MVCRLLDAPAGEASAFSLIADAARRGDAGNGFKDLEQSCRSMHGGNEPQQCLSVRQPDGFSIFIENVYICRLHFRIQLYA